MLRTICAACSSGGAVVTIADSPAIASGSSERRHPRETPRRTRASNPIGAMVPASPPARPASATLAAASAFDPLSRVSPPLDVPAPAASAYFAAAAAAHDDAPVDVALSVKNLRKSVWRHAIGWTDADADAHGAGTGLAAGVADRRRKRRPHSRLAVDCRRDCRGIRRRIVGCAAPADAPV